MTHFLPHFIARHRFHYTEMNELYISLSLRALALGVGGIFVPLFLYSIGYSVATIAAFYLYAMALRLPLEFLAAYLISRIGIKHTVAISFACLFGFFISLYFLPQIEWLWALAGLFLALEMALFWLSYHLHVSSVRAREQASTQVGITIVLRRVFMALGPLAGGFIAAWYGVEYTLLLAAACLVIAAYPLFKTPDIKGQLEVTWSHFRLSLFSRDSIAHIAHQFTETAAVYCWPLWLLLVLGHYSEIGLILALSLLLGIGFTLWIGRLGDRGHNHGLLRIGSGFKMLAHGTRAISNNFGVALFANTLNDLGDNFATGPFTEQYYEAADRGSRFAYILRINIIAVLGKSLTWVALLLLLTLHLSELAALQTIFILAALMVPLVLWVSKR